MTEIREKLSKEGVYLIKNAVKEKGIEELRNLVDKWKQQFYSSIEMFKKNLSCWSVDDSQLLVGQKEKKSLRSGNLAFNKQLDIVAIHDLNNFFNQDINFIVKTYLKPYIESLYFSRCKILYSNLLIKRPNDEGVVFFHRDLKFTKELRRSYYFGIYLDDTTKDSCVYFIKGSHLTDSTEFDESKAVPVVAKRGDICVHDAHVFHGSLGRQFKNIRETIYIGFTTDQNIFK